MIAFLHTAPAHVATFEALLRAVDAAVPSRHAVDETLLADARAAGAVTPAIARRVADAVTALAGQGAAVVVCTCSTIGAAAEASRLAGVTVLRVDRPMAERAVRLGRRIVVVAALPSTVAPTADLLHDAARRAERSIEIVEVVCAEAWPHFERGDTAAYLAEVGRTLAGAADLGDVIVLAQASMAGAADRAGDLAVPVLSSPRLGVEAAVRAYRQRPSTGGSMAEFHGLEASAAREFAERWLPAWSGNRPELLVSFYTDDVFYADPGVPAGLRGRAALLAYFTKLLGRYPDWVWTHRDSIPLADGFLNQWHASIPVGDQVVEVDGVCTVQLRDGRIYSNQVFFDRSPLLAVHRRPTALD